MSKQEIKEEYKQTEGDPQIKGKIREKQRQMASRRMMQNVPNADVVIRNPTHFAVALGYDSGKNRAPVVLAKGADHLALKIVEVAEASGVYIMEDRPLARGLYDTVEVDMEIPEEYYQTVAKICLLYTSLKQQIASHNIANVETPGYKAKKVEFRDVLYETAQGRCV